MPYLAWSINVMRISNAEYTLLNLQTERFEEEVMLSGFAQAQTKSEVLDVTFDNAQEYIHC